MKRRTATFSGRLGLVLATVACIVTALVTTVPPAAGVTFANPTPIVTTDPPCSGGVGPATIRHRDL